MTLCHLLPAQTGDLQLRYFGTAGWEISDGQVTVLIDPYLSRIKLGEGPGISTDDTRRGFTRDDHYEPDTLLIDSLISEADFILVHHSHFDHIADVPYIAKKTGAKVIATETGCNILRAYGVPGEQLYPVGGGEDYQFEDFSVRVLPGIHSALNDRRYHDSRRYPEPPEAPLKVSEFIEGGSLMFLARFTGHNVLTMGSMNFIERELEGLAPDVLLAGVNLSQRGIYKYTERLLAVTGFPPVVLPTHWDNFRVPYGFDQDAAIEQKLVPFIEEVRAVSPDTQVIIPVHLETITLPVQRRD
ncbi:MAG: MBL fold metallo-hydrolase [Saprospiraceae bacterium]|nr:MBL fold metallo-hydrolase [Saprospiraceae bacterium]